MNDSRLYAGMTVGECRQLVETAIANGWMTRPAYSVDVDAAYRAARKESARAGVLKGFVVSRDASAQRTVVTGEEKDVTLRVCPKCSRTVSALKGVYGDTILRHRMGAAQEAVLCDGVGVVLARMKDERGEDGD